MLGQRPFWWSSRNLIAIVWLPLAAIFWFFSSLRRGLYKSRLLQSHRLPVPVIVVGNIAVGGSGKTPVVLWLIDQLRKRGYRPGVVSRGYGGSATEVALLTPESDPRVVGDEPLFISRRSGVPVAIGRDRVAACEALLAVQPNLDVLVTDDGLQHYRLARDVEVLVVDEVVLGNRWLLPAGPLREGLSRLRSASLLIVHGPTSEVVEHHACGVPSLAMRLWPRDWYRLTAPNERRTAEEMKRFKAKAVAGIGHPDRFFQTLREQGLNLVCATPFADHHRFVPEDLSLDGADILLMTEKDAIKCASFAPRETWVLPVDAQIDEAALDIIVERLHGPKAA